MAGDAGDLKARALLENAEFMGALKEMVNGTTDAVTAASKQFGKMGDSVGSVFDAVTKIGALAGLTKFASDALDTANKTDKLEAAFRNLNGATDQTNALLKNLEGMEFTTMFDFEDTLGPAAKKMLELGTNSQQVGPALKAVSDAAAGMKEGPEYIGRVTDSLATMSAHVQASSKDIKALQKDGAFSWTALTDVIGGTTEEAMAKVKAGMVSAQDVTTSVTNYLETRWAGQAESVMGGWKGAMHVLSETTEEAQKSIGESIKGVLTDLTPVIKAVTAAIQEMVDLWNKMPAGLKEAIVIFTGMAAAVIAATSAVSLLTTAWKLFSAALTGNPWGIAISIGVAVLVTLGTWVAQHWGGVKAALQWLWDFLTLKFPSGSMADAFKAGQKGADDQAAAEKKLKDQHDATGAAAADDAQKTRLKEAADIAAAKAATAHAAEIKKTAEEAKKAAEVHKQYVEDVTKGYEYLLKVSPELAASYAETMGGIKNDTEKVASLFGTAWPKMSLDMKAAAVAAYEAADAFKAMGVAGEGSLSNQAAAASAAYTALGNTASATSADMVAANDKVVASLQAVTDYQNKDLKAAYENGKITVDDYYSMVESRAAAALADTQAAATVGLKTEEDVFAAKAVLAKAQKDLSAQTEKDLEAVYNAAGLQTQQQLDITKAKAEQVAAVYEAMVPPAQKAADAFKAMGVTTLDAQIKSVDDLAAALVKAKANADTSVSSTLALADANKAMDAKMQDVVKTIAGPYQDAVKAGKETQAQATADTITGLQKLVKQWQDTGDAADDAMKNKIAAGLRAVNVLIDAQKTQNVKQLQDAYHTLGVTSTQDIVDFKDKAAAAYDTLKESGTASARDLELAWINKTQDAYNAIDAEGGVLTGHMKDQLAARKIDLQNHLDTLPGMYDATYKSIEGAIMTTFDDLTKKLVTGQGSFKDIITGMWQSIATAALDYFLKPVEEAIAQFIAKSIASLLGSEGIGGVTDAVKTLGAEMSKVFTSAGTGAISGAASGAASDVTGALSGAGGDASLIGTLSNPLEGLGGSLPGAASGAAGAASGAASAVSGVMGMVSMVSGIVGAVGSVATAIGTFVEGAQENKALNSIDSNTLKAALLLGAQADGGIHAKIAQIRDALFGGPIWWELDAIRDQLNTHLEPIRTDSDTSLGLLTDIRDEVVDMNKNLVSGFSTLNITVTATGVTTKDAARALGDQIATSLSYQLVKT